MASDAGSLLWCLRGHGRDVRCMRQRTSAGLELRVLWGDDLFLTETFQDPRRLDRRSAEFRATLMARGWTAMADGASTPSAATEGTPAVSAPRVATTPVPSNPHPAPGGARPGRQPTVLIVDDEPTMRAFLRRYLEEAGYLVGEAADVDSALNALDRGPVDAVVLDVRLPDPMGWGRTGLEVLAFIRLHNAFSRLPVLVLTGYPLEPEEQDMIERHRADVYLKPGGYRMLVQRLDALTRPSLPQL